MEKDVSEKNRLLSKDKVGWKIGNMLVSNYCDNKQSEWAKRTL